MTITGVVGALRWGYHDAATLGAWSIGKDEAGTVLSAQVIHMDRFRASQRPLIFVAPHAAGAWRWPVLSLESEGAALSARLGPREC